ncbi:hypothetical protein evm_014760 [Chilo suppressalis]|nr:hypothetical protein evm_014760 [Chilo suppressalis]
MVNAAARLLSRSVSARVENGMDVTVGKVTLPHMKHPMEWGEAVEGLASAVVDNRVRSDCGDVRRTSEFLAHRILRSLRAEMNQEKVRLKQILDSTEECELKDFYVPGEVKETDPNENSP